MERSNTYIKTLILTVFFQLIFLIGCNAQNKLNREEILHSWRNEQLHKNTDADSSINQFIISFNPQTQKRISIIIDSLTNEEVDSFCILAIVNSGGLNSDSCVFGNYAIIYFLWLKNDTCFVNKNINNCTYGIRTLNSNDLFEYYSKYIKEINNEIIMPAIIEAEYQQNQLVYKTESSSEDEEYHIYAKINNEFSCYNFEESYTKNSKSLFYEYNLELKSYILFMLIDKQVKVLF